ncbi:hypothetical protein BC826DRAFT_970877 [Russula brevipes]|nr:hypothetical protein BC826DRAFT_970877 [Russula brevipes]
MPNAHWCWQLSSLHHCGGVGVPTASEHAHGHTVPLLCIVFPQAVPPAQPSSNSNSGRAAFTRTPVRAPMIGHEHNHSHSHDHGRRRRYQQPVRLCAFTFPDSGCAASLAFMAIATEPHLGAVPFPLPRNHTVAPPAPMTSDSSSEIDRDSEGSEDEMGRTAAGVIKVDRHARSGVDPPPQGQSCSCSCFCRRFPIPGAREQQRIDDNGAIRTSSRTETDRSSGRSRPPESSTMRRPGILATACLDGEIGRWDNAKRVVNMGCAHRASSLSMPVGELGDHLIKPSLGLVYTI